MGKVPSEGQINWFRIGTVVIEIVCDFFLERLIILRSDSIIHVTDLHVHGFLMHNDHIEKCNRCCCWFLDFYFVISRSNSLYKSTHQQQVYNI